MRVHKNQELGQWDFTIGRIGNISAYEGIGQLLSKLNAVVEIFRRRNLFFPANVTLRHWLHVESGAYVQPQPNEISISTPDDANELSMSAIILQSCLNMIDEHAMYPGYIDIEGWGFVNTANADRYKVDLLIWLQLSTIGAFVLSIRTQSDIWLPYSLSGKPQFDIHEKNAARLKQSLEEVQSYLQIVPDYNQDNDYVRYDGYHLANITDIDDEVIPVDPDDPFVAPDN